MPGDMKRMRCNWTSLNEYSEMRGKSILVAGGTGFIGKRAVELFKELGLYIFVISRNVYDSSDQVHYVQADLNDINGLRGAFSDIAFDYAVYMAANIPLRGTRKENYYDAKLSTLDPFINYCEAFLGRVSKFVYISSVDVFGGCGQFEYDENAPIRIATPYGLAKYVGEFYTKDICKSYGIQYSILRYSQVYGPNEPMVRIIPIIKNKMKEDKEFILFTKGTERRRFLYVDDAVKAIVHGLLYAKCGTYNIAGPDVISMKDLAELISETWNKKINLVIKGEIDGEDNIPSYENAKQDIRFIPDIGMSDGMRMIKEVEEHA